MYNDFRAPIFCRPPWSRFLHSCIFFYFLSSLRRSVWPTRFGKIPPRWQIFKNIWQYVEGLFGFRTLWHNLYAFCKFRYIVVDGQIIKKNWSFGHTVCVASTIFLLHWLQIQEKFSISTSTLSLSPSLFLSFFLSRLTIHKAFVFNVSQLIRYTLQLQTSSGFELLSPELSAHAELVVFE